MLENGSLDMVMAMRIPKEEKHCRLVLRTDHSRYVTMSASHPLAKEESVSYEQLLHEPVLGYSGDDVNTELLTAQYRRLGAELKYVQRCDQFATLLQLVGRNVGIAYLTKKLSSAYSDLTSLPIKEEQGDFITYLIWAKHGAANQAPRRLFRVFKEYFERLDG